MGWGGSIWWRGGQIKSSKDKYGSSSATNILSTVSQSSFQIPWTWVREITVAGLSRPIQWGESYPDNITIQMRSLGSMCRMQHVLWSWRMLMEVLLSVANIMSALEPSWYLDGTLRYWWFRLPAWSEDFWWYITFWWLLALRYFSLGWLISYTTQCQASCLISLCFSVYKTCMFQTWGIHHGSKGIHPTKSVLFPC